MGDLSIETKNIPSNDVLGGYNTEIKDLKELKVGSGSSIFYTDKEGSRWGHTTFDDAKAWIKVDGTAQFKTSSGDVLLSTGATDGNFINIINTALNTSTKTILEAFTFESTDYAGAFKTGNITWNETTGAITGGSGSIYNKNGLVFANAGVPTITLNGVTGAATFAGTLSAPSGTLGTITAGTITGALIQTAATGYRALLTSANGFQLYNGATWQGALQSDSNASVVLHSAGNIYLMRNGSQMAFFTGNSMDIPSAYTITWAGGGNLSYGGSYVKTNINFRADSFEAKGSGSTYYIGGTDDFAVVEAIDQQKTDGYVSNIRVGKRRLYFVGGLFRYAGAGYWEDAE